MFLNFLLFLQFNGRVRVVRSFTDCPDRIPSKESLGVVKIQRYIIYNTKILYDVNSFQFRDVVL